MNCWILFCAFLLGAGAAVAAPEKLSRLDDCQLIPTDWADGDSFQIETSDGEKLTVRLYGADCLEHHVTDTTDARRLRAQRRYFGIAGYGGSAETSIALAKQLGGEAKAEVVKMLEKPFTVFTSFADGRGDGNYKRIYGFVTTADGKDLAAELVSKGLARAFGVYRETPAGESGADYRERLQDVQMRAAKLGLGVWKHTDWDKLPDERTVQRQEETELELAVGSKRDFSAKPLNPNTAARDELMELPGIGEVTANLIIEGRPYERLDDLNRVKGIGGKTLERLASLLVFVQP